MQPIIRFAAIKDIPVIYELICKLEESQFDYTVFETICAENIINENCVYLVAVSRGDDIIGFCSCHIQNLLHHCGKVAEIQELIVQENYRGKGIGNLLINEMTQRLVNKNCISFEVTAQNKRIATHQFYETQGFKNTHKKFVKELI